MKLADQRIFPLIIILWVLASCIGGIVAGILAAPNFIQPTQIVVTQVTVYKLVITQIVGGPTYTPYPTFTQPPPTFTPPALVPIPKASSTLAPLPIPTFTPTPSDIQLVNFSWNAFPDQEAFIEIKTIPGILCSIRYTDPLGNPANLASLADQFANENGKCVWKWLINSRTHTGAASVTVSAGGKTTTYRLQIQSKTPNP